MTALATDSVKLPKVTVILRGYGTEQVLRIAENLVGTHLSSIEIALNSPDALKSIRSVVQRFGSDLIVGAGTVRTIEQASRAICVGAAFMLSPVTLSAEVISYAHANGALCIPSGFSPSEISAMVAADADAVKVFPAETLGPSYISAIQEPLGAQALMVVGGINKDNVQRYFDAGATYAGVGSGLFCRELLMSGDERQIYEEVKRFESSVNW